MSAALAVAPATAAPLPGTKTTHDRAAWRAILRWPASCESSWRTGHLPIAGVDTWRTAHGGRLVAVTCFAGAYQGSSVLYLLDAAHRKHGPLALRIYEDPGDGTPALTFERQPLGVLGFTPRTGTLTVFDKFRGPADCGIYSVFRLSGRRLVPTVVHAKTACDGRPPYDPTRWPRLPTPTSPTR